MKKKPTYDQQQCGKCGQKYADFLHECPICRGEKMKPAEKKASKNDKQKSK